MSYQSTQDRTIVQLFVLNKLRNMNMQDKSDDNMYLIVIFLTELLYTIYYTTSGGVHSGKSTVGKMIINRFSRFAFKFCEFSNLIRHQAGTKDFKDNLSYFRHNWNKVIALWYYAEAYVMLDMHCRASGIQNTEAEKNRLFSQYCVNTVEDLIVMMKADGTLTQ